MPIPTGKRSILSVLWNACLLIPQAGSEAVANRAENLEDLSRQNTFSIWFNNFVSLNSTPP